MQYMLLIYLDEQALSRVSLSGSIATRNPVPSRARELDEKERQVSGVGAPLSPTSTATSVRVQEGHRVVTDGPFCGGRASNSAVSSSSKPSDLDEAIGIAAGISGGPLGNGGSPAGDRNSAHN